MSNETCKVCGRPLDSTPGNMSDVVCWREVLPPKDGDYWNERDARECYRLGYTRELAAREAAERAKEHAELSLKTGREWHIAALDRAKVAEDDRDYFKASYLRKLEEERATLETASLICKERDDARAEVQRFREFINCDHYGEINSARAERDDALKREVESFGKLVAALDALRAVSLHLLVRPQNRLPDADANVREIVNGVIAAASDANRKPEPCPPGCAEHGEQGS